MTSESGGAMSEREEVLNEFGTAECVKRDDCTHFDCVAERKMADEIVWLRSQLAAVTADRDYYERQVKAGVVRYQPHDGETKAAYGRIYELERERDEARRLVATVRQDLAAVSASAKALRQRAERAEAVAAYIRRAFRGAVESDALAVTYKTVGSYRAGLLKTINALDTTEPTP